MPTFDTDLIPQDLYEDIFRNGFRGIFMGGCIERKEGSNIRPSGHCHFTHIKENGQKVRNKWGGWICIKSRNAERLVKNGKPTQLLLHELGHLVDMSQGGNGYSKGFAEFALKYGYRCGKYEHKGTKQAIQKARRTK